MSAPTIYGWGGLHPGSDESIDKGCICARMDNNRGLYPPSPPTVDFPQGMWWITEGCPLHAPRDIEAPSESGRDGQHG